MTKEKIIYKAERSNPDEWPEVKIHDVEAINLLKPHDRKFVDLAIKFAYRHRDEIVITQSDTINADFYIQLGTFIGSHKTMFINLLNMSADILLLPVGESSTFAFKVKCTL